MLHSIPVIVVAVVLGAGAGCTPLANEEPAPPGQEQDNQSSVEDGLSGTTDTLVALLNRPSLLSWASETITARCMRRAGFDHPAPPAPRRMQPLTLAGRPLAFDIARTEGYGLVEAAASPRERFLSELPSNLRSAARVALEPPARRATSITLFGEYRVSAARHGCIADGRHAIYGSVRNYLILWYGPQVIRAQIQPLFREAARTADVRIAASAYSRCMRAAGFRAASPRDAWERASARFANDGAKVSRAERGMAMADARCQARSRIFETLSHSLEQAASAILLRRAGALEAMTEIERSSVLRASAVVRIAREATSSS
jgi:hypothetical protein